VGILRRRWFQIFVSGLSLFYLLERTLMATSDPNYVPSVILLGAFLMPVTFVTYLYERLPNWEGAPAGPGRGQEPRGPL
jgi:hypothetical protein